MDGERCWVSFKYERLLTFCFICGKMGHDEKYCGTEIERQPLERQYGEWMSVGGSPKGTNEGSKAIGSSSHEQRSRGESGKKSYATVGELVAFVQDDNGGSGSLGGQDSLDEREKFEKRRHDVKSDVCTVSYQSGWDNLEVEKHELSRNKGSGSSQKVTKRGLVKELFKSNEDELSLMGQSIKPNIGEQEVTNPFKPKLNKENEESGAMLVGPSKGKGRVGKVNIKRSAREVGKAQSVGMNTQEILVGTKRCENIEVLQQVKGGSKRKATMVKVTKQFFSVMKRRWLLGSTTESNDSLRLKLPGA